jgi:hypothetical protein
MFNDVTRTNFEFDSVFKFVDTWHIKKYQMIIGLPDIIKHSLLANLAHRFNLIAGGVGDGGKSTAGPYFPRVDNYPYPNHETREKGLAVESLQALSTSRIDDIGDMTEPTWDLGTTQTRSDVAILPKIFGNVDLRRQLLALVHEFSDIFATQLDGPPADVTPMIIEVDQKEWDHPKNRQPFRLHSGGKEEEIRTQVTNMLQYGIIRESRASSWSQVHLVPKPGLNRWRFTLDFRYLNSCTRKLSWPIPNIPALLQRIGRTKPKYFAKFDMPIGYNQFPNAEGSKHLTSFKCWMGQYEWNRIVMGLTNAGSEFQKRMTTEILDGVIYHGVEIYIDDLLVFANSDAEFLAILRKVFERFRAKGAKLHPEKSFLGMSETEFCGHTIDSTGIHFSQDKIDSILNFPRPELKKQ